MLELKTYKNYKELCKAMNWTVSSGNTKKSQINQLDLLCKYHKEGNKFIIDNIYDTPIEKIDNRGRSAEYGEYIDKLIIHECSLMNNFEDKNNVLSLSPTRLFLKLDMINNNYTIFRKHINEVSRYYKIPYETLFDFYDNTYARNKRLIESSLNRLQNKSLIMWQTEVKVTLNNGIIRIATDDEKTLILNCELKAMKVIGYHSKKDIFLHKKWNEFRNLVKEYLEKETSLIKYYFNCYKINASNKFINMILCDELLEENKNELNAKLCEVTNKDALKRHNKIKEKSSNYLGKCKLFNNEKNRMTDEYVEDTKIITRLCIDNSTDIVELRWEEMDKRRYDYTESIMTELQKEWYDLENMYSVEDLDNLFG